ncbi:MAG TPA: cupredoxin domain-containing protein [Actinomycetota bacterium]|jgi:plastocyanin
MKKGRWVRLLAGLFALSIVLAACGGDDDGDGGETGATTGSETGSETGAAAGQSIVISGFAFDPSTITVSGSTDIAITNEDAAAHTFTTDDGSVDVEIAGGAEETVTLDLTESTGFFCKIHPDMTGTIEVS